MGKNKNLNSTAGEMRCVLGGSTDWMLTLHVSLCLVGFL